MKSFEDGLYNLIASEEEEPNGCTVYDALQLVARVWEGSQEQHDHNEAVTRRKETAKFMAKLSSRSDHD